MDSTLELTVSEFVGLLNQTLEYAFPTIIIIGELSSFRISKNRWVYFDLKDESAMVKFFGTVYQLPGPLEDGMLLKVRGQPRMHPLYGFSITIQTIQPAGEGSLKRAAELLRAKLAAEGLFDQARKRQLLYPPNSVGLITSRQSAAYADFIKILDARWRGIVVYVIDVQVQGENAPAQIVQAFGHFNNLSNPPDIVVLIRGGGSAEDLAAYNTEQVTRAVAASRVPTLVAIGHEIDLSLAELASDKRASTPSNAAELLTPDRLQTNTQLQANIQRLQQNIISIIHEQVMNLKDTHSTLKLHVSHTLSGAKLNLASNHALLRALSPYTILKRGYALIRKDASIVRSIDLVRDGDIVDVQLHDGTFKSTIEQLHKEHV